MAHRNLVLAIVLLASAPAAADTKSWAALKGNVPGSTEILVGFDLRAISGATYAKLVDGLVKQDKDIGPMLGMITQTCSLDLSKIVSDVSLSIKTKGPDEVTFAIGLDGVDEAKLVDCATKVLKQIGGKAKLTAKPGKVSEYTIDDGGSKTTIYAAWPAKDVVVFTQKAEVKSSLDGFVAGKAAHGDLSTYLGKATTSGAVVWAAATIGEDHMKGAFGSVTSTKGALSGTGHVVCDSAADATKQADGARRDVKEGLAATKKMPAAQKFLTNLKITTKGSEVLVDVSLNESDLPDLLVTMMSM